MMVIRRRASLVSAAVAISTALLLTLHDAAQAQAQKSVSPAPAAPKSVLFSEALAGRRLLYAARDAYRNAPAVRFTATWTETVDQGTGKETTTGTETVAAEPRARRLALTSETATGNEKRTRRAIANGDTLLVTRFESGSGGENTAPTREFLRLPLNSEDTLPRALQQVQFTPRTQAAALLLLEPDWSVRGAAASTSTRGEVWETETARSQQYANNALVNVTRTRRYLLDPKTRLLRRFEEWVSTEPLNGPARNARNAYVRASYRREEYRQARVGGGGGALPASLFSQALPAGYKEAALPSVSLPSAPEPAEMDENARRLLQKWTRAQERLLSYYAQIEVTFRREQNSDNPEEAQQQQQQQRPNRRNDWSNWRILYSVWMQKPNRARLTIDTTGMADRRARSLLAVADGAQVTVQDRRTNRVRTQALTERNDLGRRLQQAGFNDWAGVLDWLLAPPVQEKDRVVYRGRTLLDGEAVDLLDIVRTTIEQERGKEAEVTTTTTVALGATDGLPRQTVRRREATVSGLFDRDQPDDMVITARYRPVRKDAEPPANAFAFVAPANTPSQDANRNRRERRGGGGGGRRRN